MDKKPVKHREPLMHIVKREAMPAWLAWLVRLAAILVGMLACGIAASLLVKKPLDVIYTDMFEGAFGRILEGNTFMLWRFLQRTAILLCLALGVTPAFRMRFWNCGAEGQALAGGLASIICMIELGDKLSYPVLLVVIVVTSVLAGALWGLIPALFHAKYRTNETLFTLMMNYVITQIVAYYVYRTSAGSMIIQKVNTGNLPVFLGEKYLLNIIIVAVLMVATYIYMRYSKQGYEISVVGESQNTARYVGISVNKVIIRTMLISGAVCGVAGMLMVAGTDHSINTNTMDGQGFTAIMVSWLGQFNPFIMAFVSALLIFVKNGAANVAARARLNSSYADIACGIVILCLVGCEFFIQYSIKFRQIKKGGKSA